MDLDDTARRVLNAAFIEHDGLEGTPTYCGWIAARLAEIAAVLGESVLPERIAYTARELVQVAPAHLDWALLRILRECQTFPVPAVIFGFLKEIPAFIMPELEELD